MYDRKRSIMGKWKRVLIAAALTASVILALPVWNVGRAEATETDETEKTPDAGNTGNTQTGGKLNLEQEITLTVKRATETPQGDIEVDLYKVANAVPKTGYDTYDLTLRSSYSTEEISGLLEAAMEIKKNANGEVIDPNVNGINESYRALAQKVANIALGVTKDSDGKLTVTPVETDIDPISISGSGNGKFNNLGAGMYLVIAHGKDLTPEQYISEIETDGTKQLITMAYHNGYVYSYLPELISLPMRAAGETAPGGSFQTSSTAPWQYNVTVTLKAEEESEMASLQILKTFSGASGALAGEDGCVYQVEAELNGKKVYSNAVAIKYQGTATGGVLLDKVIPVGATVTVTEVYYGAGFDLTSDGDSESPVGTVIIRSAAADTENTVGNTASFVNTYNGGSSGGDIVTNKFPLDNAGNYTWTNDLNQQ